LRWSGRPPASEMQRRERCGARDRSLRPLAWRINMGAPISSHLGFSSVVHEKIHTGVHLSYVLFVTPSRKRKKVSSGASLSSPGGLDRVGSFGRYSPRWDPLEHTALVGSFGEYSPRPTQTRGWRLPDSVHSVRRNPRRGTQTRPPAMPAPAAGSAGNVPPSSTAPPASATT
jgi:hypothetical protein